ncbi:hypothetical protein H6P81_008202 [Aristolochia fimbriata]|uniref:Uncharacterized protein n=1 Tax=Aristolochia fimbriata TaxID=158543 RepID=A0AAV7F6W3_ARIFI|nr:hypothetical protein H6P81_008202 [Aristolochia fimbriata]
MKLRHTGRYVRVFMDCGDRSPEVGFPMEEIGSISISIDIEWRKYPMDGFPIEEVLLELGKKYLSCSNVQQPSIPPRSKKSQLMLFFFGDITGFAQLGWWHIRQEGSVGLIHSAGARSRIVALVLRYRVLDFVPGFASLALHLPGDGMYAPLKELGETVYVGAAVRGPRERPVDEANIHPTAGCRVVIFPASLNIGRGSGTNRGQRRTQRRVSTVIRGRKRKLGSTESFRSTSTDH